MKTDKELVGILRNYAQAYTSDKRYNFDPEFALIIANRMEQLIALAENGQSAIDTNKRLIGYIYGIPIQVV